MTELKVCPECGHVDGNKNIKIGDRLWYHGIHYIIATVDVKVSKQLIGVQLIDPDNGTRCAQHPIYVSNSDDIKESELKQLMTYGSKCNPDI